MFLLLNSRFTFYELENDEKNICWRARFTAIAHLQNAPITASSEMCPIPNFLLLAEKFCHLFKTFKVLVYERNTHYLIIFNLMIGKYLEPRKELTWFAWSKHLQKYWTGVTFGYLSWFSWTKTIISSFYFKNYLRNKIMQRKTYVDVLY